MRQFKANRPTSAFLIFVHFWTLNEGIYHSLVALYCTCIAERNAVTFSWKHYRLIPLYFYKKHSKLTITASSKFKMFVLRISKIWKSFGFHLPAKRTISFKYSNNERSKYELYTRTRQPHGSKTDEFTMISSLNVAINREYCLNRNFNWCDLYKGATCSPENK